jgi:hypothetical protein
MAVILEEASWVIQGVRSPGPFAVRQRQTALFSLLIDMLFYLFMLGASFVGAVTGAEFGAKLFGIVGGIAGAVLGGGLGFVLGCFPYAFAMISTSNDVERKSVEELHASLRGVGPMCPNFVLLELQARGEDIEQHLPFILAMMEAPDSAYRQRGAAAFYSAFPELAKNLNDYRIYGSAEARHEAVEKLRKPA